jgi:hypothetical protein
MLGIAYAGTVQQHGRHHTVDAQIHTWFVHVHDFAVPFGQEYVERRVTNLEDPCVREQCLCPRRERRRRLVREPL